MDSDAPSLLINQAERFEQPNWSPNLVINAQVVHLPGAVPTMEDRRSVFASLLSDVTAHFGGRADYLAAIRVGLETVSGYQLIVGASGFGKTALMAEVVRKNWLDTAYHFFNRFYSTPHVDLCTEDTFLAVVCQQLAQIRGWDMPPSTSALDLRSFYIRALREPAESPFVLILDGLDEAGFPLIGCFPSSLGTGVHVVATARASADRNWIVELGLPANAGLVLEVLHATDVGDILKAAGETAERYATDDGFVAEVLRVSNGDPFYVRFLCEDIVAGRIGGTNVTDQPAGLHAYLERWWQTLVGGGDFVLDLVDVLCLIFAAYGPISRKDILLSLPDRPNLAFTIDSALARIARFLIGDSDAGYQFCHPRFRAFLETSDKIPQNLVSDGTRRLATYCASWQSRAPGGVTPYVDAFAARHMAATGDLAAMVEFASAEWGQHQLARTATYGDLVNDIAELTAAVMSRENPPLPTLANLILKSAIVADRSSELNQEFPELLAVCGDVERALGVARLAPTADGADSTAAYQLACVARACAGRDPTASEQISRIARVAAEKTNDVMNRVSALLVLAGLEQERDDAIDLAMAAVQCARALSDNTSGKKALCMFRASATLVSLDPTKAADALLQGFAAVMAGEFQPVLDERESLIVAEIGMVDTYATAALDELLLGVLRALVEGSPADAVRVVDVYLDTVDDLLGHNQDFVDDALRGLTLGSFRSEMVAACDTTRSRLASSPESRSSTGVQGADDEPLPDRESDLVEFVRSLAEVSVDPTGQLVDTLQADAASIDALVEAVGLANIADETRGLLVRRLLAAVEQATSPTEHAFALAAAARNLRTIAPDESARLLDEAARYCDSHDDGQFAIELRFQVLGVLGDVPDVPLDDIVAPLLLPDSDPAEQFLYTLVQISTYQRPHHDQIADRIAALVLAAIPRLEFSTSLILLKPLASVAPRPVGEALVSMMAEVLRAPRVASYYERWCVAQMIPVVAAIDRDKAHRSVFDLLGRLRTPALVGILRRDAEIDPEAFDELISTGTTEKDWSGIVDGFGLAAEKRGLTVDDILERAEEFSNCVPEDYGQSATTLCGLVRVLRDADPALASTWYARAVTGLPNLEETYRGRVAIALVKVRADESETLLVDDIAESFSSTYWHDQILIADAQWKLRHGVETTKAVDRLLLCRDGTLQLAGLLGCLSEVSTQETEVLGGLEIVGEQLMLLGDSFDLADLLISFARLAPAARSREAIEHAISICDSRAENLLGTRSRLLANAADVLVDFDSTRALGIARRIFEGDGVRVLPRILDIAVGSEPDLEASLCAELVRYEARSLGSRFVFVGSAVPILERINGPQYVSSLLDLVADACRF